MGMTHTPKNTIRTSRMTSRPARRPSWGSMAVVAPGSLAFLAATVVWVSGHDPRAADAPTDTAGPTAAASSTTTTTTTSGPAGPGDVAQLSQDAANSLQLARLQALLGQTEAQLQLLERGAGAAVQAPSPLLADVSPPVAAVPPSTAPAPAPAAHATTGASGA